MREHEHADFANVVWVSRFHQAPRPRIVPIVEREPATIIILPVIRIERRANSMQEERASP